MKSPSAEWLPARDQYLRSILHLPAFQGNTRLVKCLVYAGAVVNDNRLSPKAEVLQ